MWTTAIAVACIVFFAHWLVTAISGPLDKKPPYKPSSTGYSGSSQPSATSSPNHGDTPKEKPASKDPNEGYYVTGHDAYGASERRDSFGLTTQRKNDFGNWENV